LFASSLELDVHPGTTRSRAETFHVKPEQQAETSGNKRTRVSGGDKIRDASRDLEDAHSGQTNEIRGANNPRSREGTLKFSSELHSLRYPTQQSRFLPIPCDRWSAQLDRR